MQEYNLSSNIDRDYIEVSLDLHDKTSTNDVQNYYILKQGDHNSRVLRCILTKGGLIPIDLKNSVLTLYIKKVDMGLVAIKGVIVDATNGVVDFPLTRQALAIADDIVCEVVKVGTDESTMSFPLFKLQVEDSIADEDLIESTDDFSLLNQALGQVAKWESTFDDKYTEIGNRFNSQYTTWEGKFESKYNNLERDYAKELTEVKDGLTETNAQLSDINSQFDTKVNKDDYLITKSKVTALENKKVTQDDISEELLLQITGNTPVNSVPSVDSITPQMLKFKAIEGEVGKNKFNKNAVLVGKYISSSNGQLLDNAQYTASEFIPVEPNTQYFLKHSSFSAFYDMNKSFISGGSYNGFTTPTNAYYFRCSTLITNLETQQLELGIGASLYEAFEIKLRNNSIKDDGAFQKKSIKFDKLEAVPVVGDTSLNLFNKFTAVNGYYVASVNGTLQVNVDYCASGFIEVTGGQSLIIKYSGQTAFYDANYKFISGGTYTTVTVPTNAKFMKISTLLTNLETQQINVGTTLLKYTIGGTRLKPKAIYDSNMFDSDIIPESALTPEVRQKLNSSNGSYIDYNNFENGLRKFRSCVAKTQLEEANEIYNICFVGDSITEGVGCSSNYSDYLKYGYLARTRKRFNEKFGDCGNGFIPVYYAQQFTLNGDWRDFTLLGIAGNCKWTSTGTATINFNGNGLALVTQLSPNGGNIRVAVDGTDYTLSCQNATNQIGIVKIDGLPNKNHTATISIITSDFQFKLIGAYEIKGTKGFRLNTCAKSGVSSRQLTTNANIIASEIDVFKPVLTVLATCTNDVGQSLTTDEYKTNMQTLITAAKKYGDVLLFPTMLRVDKSDSELKPYINVLKQLVIDNNIAMIDIYSRWGRQSQTLEFMDDILHPNKIGAMDIANALTEILLK